MTGRFSLVAGSPTQWAAVLRLMDSNAALSRAELNQLLDTLALSLDARREPPRSIASVRAHLPCVIVRAKSLDHPAPLIELARSADLQTIAAGYGVTLRRAGVNEFVGPCPACGQGRDRFSINLRKRLWNCRQCGVGGDAIALVRHIENVSFEEAIERLAGGSWEPSEPMRPIPALASFEAVDDRSDGAATALARQRWNEAIDPRRTIVETYLAGRGLELSTTLRAR